MSDRIQLRYNPTLAAWDAEANDMGVSLPRLLMTDLTRLRAVLASAAPKLTDWEYNLLDSVLPDEGMEMATYPAMGERILSASSIFAALVEWADGTDIDEAGKAQALAMRARGWSDIERWALMVRRRAKA